MAQVTRSRKIHPVIVVGSGASGGMAAWNLTRKGINVLLLDAGTKFERSQFWTHVRPWEARARRARGEKPPEFFLDTKEQPYLTPEGKPFQLIRVWGHGGKTNVWGRVSLRYADLDFKGPAQDGWEIPWPIEYKDVAPYYDQVDQLIGVCGGDDDSDSLPGSKFHMPPPAPRCGEVLLSKGFAKTNIPIVAGRRANRTKPLARVSRVPLLRQLRRGVRHRIVLLFGRPPAARRHQDRQAGAAQQRRRRARARGRQGPGQRRAVLRPRDGQGRARLRQGRDHGRLGGGYDAHPAELQVHHLSQRHRQRIRCHRAVSVRAAARACRRVPPAALRQWRPERPGDRRRAHLHAAVQPSAEEPELPARIPDAVLEHRLPAVQPAARRQSQSTASARG